MDLCKVNCWVPYKMVALTSPGKCAGKCVLYILTSKCASRHKGVHLFDITTSKSGPNMVCFVDFDLEMCFASQRRALFRYHNFQKRSENGVFGTFWLGCASHHNGVEFFDITTSKSGPSMVCFVHFDLERCFASQRRALFPQLNFQKCSERDVLFLFFYLQTRFAPQRTATFNLSSGQLAPHPPL